MDAAPSLGGIELSALDFTFPVDAVIRQVGYFRLPLILPELAAVA